MDKNKIIRRLQSARHLLSADDDRIDLDCCRLALGNIEEAIEELRKPSWVSLRDVLPEAGQCVLVCDEAAPSDMWFGHLTDRMNFIGKSSGLCSLPPLREFTHWQYIEPLQITDNKFVVCRENLQGIQ